MVKAKLVRKKAQTVIGLGRLVPKKIRVRKIQNPRKSKGGKYV